MLVHGRRVLDRKTATACCDDARRGSRPSYREATAGHTRVAARQRPQRSHLCTHVRLRTRPHRPRYAACGARCGQRPLGQCAHLRPPWQRVGCNRRRDTLFRCRQALRPFVPHRRLRRQASRHALRGGGRHLGCHGLRLLHNRQRRTFYTLRRAGFPPACHLLRPRVALRSLRRQRCSGEHRHS